jgi:Na+/H+ antiporter NhaC
MLVVPIIVGKIFTRTSASIADPSLASLKSAVNAEYFFVGLAIIAIAVSIILGRSADKNPHLRIDMPNKQ